MFDIETVKRAVRYNAPTALALMGLDRLDFANNGILKFDNLTPPAVDFVSFVESHTGVPIKFAGTGFRSSEAISLPIENKGLNYANA